MRFWDSSALLPLVVEERRSSACRALRRTDPSIAVWALTRTELVSAVHRLARSGALRSRDLSSAARRIDVLARVWTEVDALAPTRERAERLLGSHALAAADALQLAAALVLANERPKGRSFVTADAQLAVAAEAEGFVVIVPRP